MAAMKSLKSPPPERTLDELLERIEWARGWVADFERILADGEACLKELKQMRYAVRRGGRAVSWEEVLDVVRAKDLALGDDLASCRGVTVRLGKIRALAPDGAIYARLNLYRDEIQGAIEDHYQTSFQINIMHSL